MSKIADLTIATALSVAAGTFGASAGDCPQKQEPRIYAPGILRGTCPSSPGLGGLFNIDPNCLGKPVQPDAAPKEIATPNDSPVPTPKPAAPKPAPCDYIS